MKAIISDIHGNLEALTAVLEDIQSKDVSGIVCLGDVVGYGPNPVECLDLLADTDVTILGNHEEAVLTGEFKTFNRRAQKAVEWTRNILIGESAGSRKEPMKKRLESFPKRVEREGVLLVHGSPREDCTREYIRPRHVRRKAMMKEVFEAFDSICFVGHTHIPGVFRPREYMRVDELLGVYIHDSGKALVNVGSVGQPRDKDPRACYITFDGEAVVFRKVAYDVDKTCEKIEKIPQLDRFLASRLKVGK